MSKSVRGRRRTALHLLCSLTLYSLTLCLGGIVLASARQLEAEEKISFVDVAESLGIEGAPTNGATGKRYLIETMGPGAAWIDYDGDGWLDLYLVDAHDHPERALVPGGVQAAQVPGNRLFRNEAGKRFVDVTAKAGVGDRGYGMGVAVGDFDGDGHDDLFVTNYGPNVLYRNLGDGRFEDVTESAGVAGGSAWSTSAAWADLDGDGRLDLWVVNYLKYDTRSDGACKADLPGGGTTTAHCNPKVFEGVADQVFLHLGKGRFRDVSEASGIAVSRGWLQGKGLGVVLSDYDADGDPDVLVANDSVANVLWRNLGKGRFEDASLESGFALNADGESEACMGIARGDVDGDGLFDYFVTNYSRETNTLWRNEGGALFDATIEAGLARCGYLPLGFGTLFLDADSDGDLDIYIANGHILDNVERIHPGENITWAQTDLLLLGDGRGRFRDASSSAGEWFGKRRVGRSVARADFDNDGDHDLLVTGIGVPPALLENRSARRGTWIGLELRAPRGPSTSRAVVEGARVEVRTGKKTRVFEVGRDGSYLASSDPRVLCALPSAAREVDISISWVGRELPDLRSGLAVGRYHSIERPAR